MVIYMTNTKIDNSTTNNRPKQMRKLTKYEEIVCKSILAHDIYFTYYGENCDLRTVVNNIFNQEDFDGYGVFAKFINSAVYEKQTGVESNFLPTDMEKDIDTNVEKKFFTVNASMESEDSTEENIEKNKEEIEEEISTVDKEQD